MATSDTEIANMALLRFGNGQISSLTEGTEAADRLNLVYANSRDSVLRAHPWNFAIRRATLALSATTPNHEYTYQHALPSDPYCLKVIRTEWDANGFLGSAVYGFPGVHGISAPVAYRIEGRFLMCNETVARIEYIARITDVSQYDELFVDVLAQRLAAEVCVSFTGNQSMAKGLWDVYVNKLDEARGVDGQEGTPREVVDVSPWLIARI